MVSLNDPDLDERFTLENSPCGHQEWSKCILQEGFSSSSSTVVDTKRHIILPALTLHCEKSKCLRLYVGPHRLYVLFHPLSAGTWPATSEDPAPVRQCCSFKCKFCGEVPWGLSGQTGVPLTQDLIRRAGWDSGATLLSCALCIISAPLPQVWLRAH